MRPRTVKQSKKLNAVVLSVAVIGLLLAVTPAVGQTNDGTVTSTTTTTQSTNSSPSDGIVVDTIPVRKDAWSWYWNEKAHLDTNNQNGFWGDDAISNLFKNVSNNFVVPFWNAAMEYDFIRVCLLLILAGMLLGFGASFFLPKKPEAK
jgi:hypothetical protein